MTDAERRAAAKQFVEMWTGKGYEKGQSQPFWLSLLRDVLGVKNPEQFIIFEDQVVLDHTSFIDGIIPETHVLIEQKGINKDLRKAIKQSDGTMLSPFQQAKRYSADLPYSKRPRWIVTCNFKAFLIYDMEKPNGEPEEILLENLPAETYCLEFLVDTGDNHIKKEMEISIQAGELVGKLYDELLKQYIHPDDPDSLKNLNMLCVRLVFCLYAEDAGIFGKHGKFHSYLKDYNVKDVRRALIDLFKVLDTKPTDRDPYLEPTLASFPYVNGGLFSEAAIEIPNFNETIVNLLLDNASEDFDWSEISPTIFGAVFESTLNPSTRRSGGMHYTSIENIHKVIDPLFLDELKEKFADIKAIPIEKTRNRQLEEFQTKLSRLTFLDPACGSGNFLTESYLALRKLENEVLKVLLGDQIRMGTDAHTPIKVSINQFYGIEINDFAVSVGKTALWIAESQMMMKTEDIIHMHLDFLPLKSYANIVEGNALRLDWEAVVPKTELDYIMGNPPFSGARMMSKEQKSDMDHIFGKLKGASNLDFVCAWFEKAAKYIDATSIHAAFVSTNSTTQGEQSAILWKDLMEQQHIHIDFAYRTFKWDSEAKDKAAVHCVIVGFSQVQDDGVKRIYLNESIIQFADNINGYLVDAPNVFVESRTKTICDVPSIGIGNQPIDGGFYLFTEEEKYDFITKEPQSEKWFKKWYGAKEFISQKPRYCLWLGDCPPNELRKMSECLKRVEAVKAFRMESKRGATLKLAETPTRFQVENMPKGNYVVIPEVSSERRRYIPIGFMNSDILCSNKVRLMPNATLYHFGILESNVHMAWMRAVCCRLKSDYSYSINIVYNNFVWPTPTDQQQAMIEKTAQEILNARALYPDSSFADLYDETVMPSALRKAHQLNDRAVMDAYGFDKKITESECVAELMRLYQEKVIGSGLNSETITGIDEVGKMKY
ncbi:DNA methyltransferase [Acetobacterium tundrae]|uniref:site-specific DNA-methyltransferase (adenine-specific) n=1 Tax=Acetobacterium tundrae TaxID=132932 RepID=A0ABR6WK25_9FIRM|nr:DNA methyltransferase [Acetobacterium tundrae]MBC3796860.1 N-6 DNA methylase [Acetobacterium tundrae]